MRPLLCTNSPLLLGSKRLGLTLGKFLFQIIEATRGGMPARDGNRSPRDDRSWGSRAKDFVICAEAALRGKKGDPYPLNNSSLGRWVG